MNGITIQTKKYRLRPLFLSLHGALVLAVGLLVAGRILNLHAHRQLAHQRGLIAAEGGGVVIVSQPRDCIETANITRLIASRLTDHSIPARGLILRGRAGQAVMDEAMKVGNARFPHTSVSRRTFAALLRSTGYDTTPLALVVDSEGRITGLEHITNDSAVADRVVVMALQAGRGPMDERQYR